MPNTELEEIETSLQALARRAYDLGRDDALKRVVSVLSGDRPFAEHLALMAPAREPAKEKREASFEEASEAEHEKMNGVEPVMPKAPAPWWAWRVR